MKNNKGGDSKTERADNIKKIMASPTYLRADEDLAFMARDELRPSRLQLEFLKPELQLEEMGVRYTIVAFGGARIVEECIAQHDLEMAEKVLSENPGDPRLKRKVAIAKRILNNSKYYNVAREFGQIVGKSGHGPLDCRLVAVTGGGPGLMEAVNRGAYDVGAKSVGLNITLPHEQEPNAYITPELCFQFRYFALRKMHFLLRAKALVVFPGGYGTFDELFEVLCLIQTEKVDPLPIILVGQDYWHRAFDAHFLADEGTISDEDIFLFSYAETAEEIWKTIVGWYELRGHAFFLD